MTSSSLSFAEVVRDRFGSCMPADARQKPNIFWTV
jgi:hypothetical protein